MMWSKPDQVGTNDKGDSLTVKNNPILTMSAWDHGKAACRVRSQLKRTLFWLRSTASMTSKRFGGVRIAFNEKLTDISGLSKLNSVGKDQQGKSVVIVNNPNLRDLSGLRGLQGLLSGALHISGNTALQTLDGVEQVSGIGFDENGVSLNITDNEQLHSIEGLSGVQGRLDGSVVVMMNPSLKVLSGLQAISEIGADVNGDSLTVKVNAILRDMLGFKGLTKTDGAVTVSNNEHLVRSMAFKA